MNQIISNEALLLSIHNEISLTVVIGARCTFCIKIGDFAVLKEDSEKYPLSHRGEKFASPLTVQNNL
jgi:hypothetical protein